MYTGDYSMCIFGLETYFRNLRSFCRSSERPLEPDPPILQSASAKIVTIRKDVTGVQALCDVLKANATITHLDLRNNRINSQGVIFLAEVAESGRRPSGAAS